MTFRQILGQYNPVDCKNKLNDLLAAVERNFGIFSPSMELDIRSIITSNSVVDYFDRIIHEEYPVLEYDKTKSQANKNQKAEVKSQPSNLETKSKKAKKEEREKERKRLHQKSIAAIIETRKEKGMSADKAKDKHTIRMRIPVFDPKPAAEKKRKKELTNLPNPAVPLVRGDIHAITSINTFEEVDAAIECFIWPSLKYDRKDDFAIQNLIGKNEELLAYYHKKMGAYFGIEHVLKNDYDRRIAKAQNSGYYERVSPTTVIVPTPPPVRKTDPKLDNPKVGSSFEATKVKTWILDWECVTFHEGYFVVSTPDSQRFNFAPKSVQCTKAKSSFNFIRKYIKEKVPTIFCEVYAGRLTIKSPILIDEAIMTFAKVARQRGIKSSNKTTPKLIIRQLTFNEAISKASRMTPAEFAKYKSKYINYLVDEQSREFKIIPCVEKLAHANSEITEYAFLFSLQCRSGKILVVHENVNPDRSTLLFLVPKESYLKSIRSIYDFLQSAEINKRSSLRSGDLELNEANITSYKSINHDEFYTWKSTISFYESYR